MRLTIIVGVVTIGIVVLPSCEALVIEPETIKNIAEPQKIESQENVWPAEIDGPIIPEDHPAIACMVKKAHQIAGIRWIPLKSVPSLSGNWTPAGTQMRGIPYSSVKEKDKFVGQEVSFYTFMSAVHNPRSVLYTEDVKKYPYYGENCGMYYGTVCSMAVNYALGIDRPVESKMYETLPYIARVKYQNLDNMYAGDILWSKGHVVLIIGIERDEEGLPESISILESSGNTRIKILSREAFQTRWEDVGWVAYRYLKLADNVNYEPLPFIVNPGDPEVRFEYNDDICISRGEYSCYLQGEDVVVNVFNQAFDRIELYNNEDLRKTIPLNPAQEDYVLSNLPGGLYFVRLANDEEFSHAVTFEVIDERTQVTQHITGYQVNYSSQNGIPEYIVICSRDGNREAIIDITEEEVRLGNKTITEEYPGEYLKVFYKGRYGRVSNNPILL